MKNLNHLDQEKEEIKKTIKAIDSTTTIACLLSFFAGLITAIIIFSK